MSAADLKYLDEVIKAPALHAAIERESLSGMKRVLLGCSAFVANCEDRTCEDITPLSHARLNDPIFFKWVLSHPKVDVNRGPRTILCQVVHEPVLRSLLLRDSRLILGLVPGARDTPLRSAVRHLEDVKALMADGRPLDEDLAPRGDRRKAIQLARELRDWETDGVVALIEEYRANSDGVRKRLRRELGVDEQDAGSLYTIVVLLCDGILTFPSAPQLPPVPSPPATQDLPEASKDQSQEKVEKARRFFAVACRLPLELQALLCLRVYDCPKDVISRKVTEAEFSWLLERLRMEDYWKGEMDPSFANWYGKK